MAVQSERELRTGLAPASVGKEQPAMFAPLAPGDCSDSSNSAASGRAEQCASAPLPRSRSPTLRACSSSDTSVSGGRGETLAPGERARNRSCSRRNFARAAQIDRFDQRDETTPIPLVRDRERAYGVQYLAAGEGQLAGEVGA